MSKPKPILIGYSGHAYVVCDALLACGITITHYCEQAAKQANPFELEYLGPETGEKAMTWLKESPYFIAIGDNVIRARVAKSLSEKGLSMLTNVIHPRSVLAHSALIGMGIFVAAQATINPLAQIGDGVICNTGCIIEHECHISPFAHIAPGAVLAGNVTVGEESFVGANCVVKQGIRIGKNVTIGAGSVVIRDIPDNITVVGNPARPINHPTI